MKAPRHEMILASAGSGKTFALTDRLVALLAGGAAPERIVALTFTRKAAGEFFDEILKKLAGAAGDAEAARRLAGRIGAPRHGPADFLALLRRMVEAMPRLRLGTLDSFFAQIVGAFPLELGLAGDFTIFEEHAARREQRRVLQRMFARAGGITPAQQEFIEAFKRATFGREEKRLGAQLDELLGNFQNTYLDAPAAELWGDATRIWPAGCAWLEPQGRRADAVAALQAALAEREMTDGQRERWTVFFQALAAWEPGMDLGDLAYLVKNALAVWPGLLAGEAEPTVERRKFPLGRDACAALVRIVTEIVGAELKRKLETTRGIFAVLRSYEAVYDGEVRRAGRLTFADVQRLLAPTAGAPPLAQDDGGGGRLLIDYRLDAGIDHWLLDEFQDTSFGQWSVLKNLIDEAVQDAEGRRSFFCVGDVKQAVYAWREGDPRLFREIFNHYNTAAPGAITERPLVDSWRSGPALIGMINAVFGADGTLTRLFPGEASTAWNREWRAHTSAVPQRPGQAALLHAADEPARWAMVLQILREIRPLERGLTCALLVRKNDTATDLADYLRREGGLPAVAESDLRVCVDNPLGAAMLALVQAAAHPGDTLAQEHLRMTPLGAVLAAEKLHHPEDVTTRVLGQIHAEGFKGMAEWWLERLEPRLAPDDAFSRVRARQWAAAAGEFDATGSREAGEFVAFMAAHKARDAESATVVRVMTVHKSKGLGFDVVLLPDLEGHTLAERRDGLAVQKAADRSVEWVLDLPSDLYRQQDAVLEAHVTAAKAAACYENLSVLYVAMTRAKRGLYVITKPPGTSKSANYPRLLADTLGGETGVVRVGALALPGAWTAGDPDWQLTPGMREPAAGDAGATAISPDPGLMRAPRRPARRPSAENSRRWAADRLFDLEAGPAADFGVAVHARLAEVEWGSVKDAARWAGIWDGKDPAAAEALACLRAPELAEVWAKPSGSPRAMVWRERSFEIVLDGAWVTGVFDRVMVRQDAAGQPTSATIWDFKTDRVGSEADIAAAAERHAGQLALYRQVVAVLTGLVAGRITCELVLTRLRRRTTVSLAGAR